MPILLHLNQTLARFHPRDSDYVYRADRYGITYGSGNCSNLALAYGCRSGNFPSFKGSLLDNLMFYQPPYFLPGAYNPKSDQ